MKKASSDLVLLDINVLLALAWPNHQFHTAAGARLDRHQGRWATCAITQLGFIRLSCNPAAVSAPRRPVEAAGLLSQMTDDPAHQYLSSLPAPSAADVRSSFDSILGHKQVMDAYLVALAHHNGAVFLTFDARIRAMEQGGDVVELIC